MACPTELETCHCLLERWQWHPLPGPKSQAGARPCNSSTGGTGRQHPTSECVAGPSRLLFLPGGLLEPTDVPSYLNGTLAGE